MKKIRIQSNIWKKIQKQEDPAKDSFRAMVKKIHSDEILAIALKFMNSYKNNNFKKLIKGKAKTVHALSKVEIHKENN